VTAMIPTRSEKHSPIAQPLAEEIQQPRDRCRCDDLSDTSTHVSFDRILDEIKAKQRQDQGCGCGHHAPRPGGVHETAIAIEFQVHIAR